ncbi:ankyrin repeat domain-containing protein 50, partial [Biomphalaria glabrata]
MALLQHLERNKSGNLLLKKFGFDEVDVDQEMDFFQQEFTKAMEAFQSQKIQIQVQQPDILQSLGISKDCYENLRKLLASSKFKDKLEKTETKDLKKYISDFNKLEANFNVTYLMICAMFGYDEKGLELIQNGADVNQVNNEGLTALMFASIFQNDDFVKMLLENKADIYLKDRRHMNALMWSVLQGYEDIVEILLEHNADVHCKTPNGLDALHIAVEKGFTKIVEMLLEKNICVSSKSLDGRTPLMRSVALPDSNIAKLLINKNADLHETTYDGKTALHISVICQNCKGISLLMKHGAKMNCKDALGMTPLMFAASVDNAQLMHTLLDFGAKETIDDVNKFKQNALCWAILRNVKNIAHLLIDAKSKTNIFDINGYSPIQYASKNKCPEIVEKLLKDKSESWHTSDEYLVCLLAAVEENDIETTRCLLNFQNKKHILSEIFETSGKCDSTSLFTAVMSGNKELVKLLLDAGADVNAVNIFLQSPLFSSVLEKNLDMTKLLVQTYKAKVNLKDYRGDTPLILAASTKNKPMVDFLLKRHASRHLTNTQGISAMMEAASSGCRDIVGALHCEGYNLELSDSQGWTPLMFASFSGDHSTVEFLLDVGAKIDASSNLCATSLIIACGQSQEKAVSVLLDRGASVNAKDLNCQTGLIYAARNGHKAILELLLRSGVDVNQADVFKRTSLMHAVLNADLESLKVIIQHKADCCLGDVNGITPLMQAAYMGFTECVQELLELKVPVDEANLAGNTALHFCSSWGHLDAVAILLLHNANPNVTNLNGDSPIMLAAAKGHDEIVERFLNCDLCDVNQCNTKDGRTSLMIATHFNHLSTVMLLTKSKVHVNAKNKSGNTALHLSVMKGFTDVVKHLLTVQNIDIHSENFSGMTPLFLCVEHHQYEILELLLKPGNDVKKTNRFGQDVITFSIKLKSLAALQILQQRCQISPAEKNRYLEVARRMSYFEIVDFLQQWKPSVNTQEADNIAPFTLQASIKKEPLPDIASMTVNNARSSNDHDLLSTSMEQQMDDSDRCSVNSDQILNLPIDDFKASPLFNLSGDWRGA